MRPVVSGRLEGRTALVTGAASGIGRATAELFAREDAEVVLFGLGGDALEEAARVTGGRAVHGNVADNADVERAIAACGDTLDIVVDAAGLMLMDTPETLTDEDWEKSLSTSPAR